MKYPFDENTTPKDIVTHAMLEITEIMKDDGFGFIKSKSNITKKSNSFIFELYSQSNRYNTKDNIDIWLHASVSDSKKEVNYWNGTLAFSNSKKDIQQWKLYGEQKIKDYEESLHQIKKIIQFHLLPFFKRFEEDFQNLIKDVVENGFCPFSDKQVYDAHYKIPIAFLSKYATKDQITLAFQYYIDRHELDYVKSNMKKAIALLQEGKPVIKNGEKEYAEFVVKNALSLLF